MIKQLLQFAEKETLTLVHLKKASLLSGVSEREYVAFKKKYIANSKFEENVITFLTAKFQ